MKENIPYTDHNHIMYKLFLSFERNNIRYLHFKSNTNLSESFKGRGDFDVLVDKREILKVERIISEHNGKRHNPVEIGNYAGVDNWLVFDERDGKIYHLHLHYQLVTGKKLVKDYVIPWDELLFSTRIKDPTYGIYITDPNVELMLLSTRTVLKSDLFDYIKKHLGLYKFSKATQHEWDDLQTKVTRQELLSVVEKAYSSCADKITNILMKKKWSYLDYLWFHRLVRRTMSVNRRYGGFEATCRTIINQSISFLRLLNTRKMNGLSIAKKTSLQGGAIIAFVGVDGAGKSTISNEISKWIRSSKIESKRFYMGTGDGKTTFFSSIVKRMIKANINLNKKKKKDIALPTHDKVNEKTAFITFFHSPIRYVKKFIIIMQINSIQKNNRKKIEKMYRYKLNGGISVLDRWPQLELPGQNDGPKIINYRKYFGDRRILKRFIEKEKRNLGVVKTIKPDIIFKLNISLDTCMNRKEEHTNREGFDHKIKELNMLSFQNANIINIDAELPYNEELLQIKKQLWLYI